METRETKFWWLYSLVGLIIFIGGFWILRYPVDNYVAIGIFFSVLLFVIGILEVIYSLANIKRVHSWVWIFVSGIFDLVLGIILMSNEALTLEVLPFIFGIWLAFTGIAQIGRAILLKDILYSRWGWMLTGGILSVILALLVIFYPLFGALSILIWTSASFMIIGIFTIIYSVILKKLRKEQG